MLYKFARNISTNIPIVGKRAHFKLGELSSLFIFYNITISWLKQLSRFWFYFSLRDNQNALYNHMTIYFERLRCPQGYCWHCSFPTAPTSIKNKSSPSISLKKHPRFGEYILISSTWSIRVLQNSWAHFVRLWRHFFFIVLLFLRHCFFMNVRKFRSNHIQKFFNFLVGFQTLFAVFDDLITKLQDRTTLRFTTKVKQKNIVISTRLKSSCLSNCLPEPTVLEKYWVHKV